MSTQLTRRYDVFISYRRTPEDEKLRDEFVRAIEKLKLYPFSDATSLPAGVRWEAAIHEVLKSNAVLLVLGTEAVLHDPNWVKKEVDLATQQGNDILLFQFADGVAKALGLLDKQYRAAKLEGKDYSSGRLFEVLEDDLHDCLRRRFAKPREEAAKWVQDVLAPIPHDFWQDDWRFFFPEDSSVALLADGGSGKTVCLAHHLKDVLQQDEQANCHVILIDSSILKRGGREIALLIGAHSGNAAAHAAGLKEKWGERFLFIVDGLDRVGFESKEVLDRIKETLQTLSECGRVVVTCRKQVWENDYQGLSFEQRTLGPLPQRVISAALPKVQTTAAQRKMLEIPLFLDHAIVITQKGRALPENPTDFLHDIYDQPVRWGPSTTLPDNVGKNLVEFLKALASEQLDEMTFEVPRGRVLAKVDLAPDDATKALIELRNAGVLREKGELVRLRHDFIDGHGMVLILYDDAGLRQKLWDRINGDCGWQVASLLVLAAHDKSSHELIDEAFEKSAYILDHKRFTPELDKRYTRDMMAQAWSVTYMLRERVCEVWPNILQYLDGDLAGSLDPSRPEQLNTRVSRPGLVTQETASTFTSSFLAMPPDHAVNSEPIVRVLKKWLERPGYEYKIRFVQALARLDTRESRDALLEFARQEAGGSKDSELVEALAESLGESRERAAIPVLRSIYDSAGTSARAHRLALEALHRIDALGGWPKAIITDDEMVEGLGIKNKKGEYSDWHRVDYYAQEAKRKLSRQGHLSQRVVQALIAAMDHQQTFVKKPVAECLGFLDEPEAYRVLLKEILKPAGAAIEVRSACLDALKGQLLRQKTLRDRLAFRWRLLFAATVAQQSGHTVPAKELISLATRESLFTLDDWLVRPTAVQALPFAGEQQGWKVRATVTSADACRRPFSIDEFLTDQDLAMIGRPLETKYRLVESTPGEEGPLNLRLAPTDWVSGRGFHLLCSRDLANVERLIGHSPMPIPLGADCLPGILAVHCVVITSDQRVLLVRRSDNTSYFPGHWSVSFEEQVTSKDFNDLEDFASAASRRGFTEEFGKDLRIRSITVISGLIEVQILNFGLVLVMELDETADMVRKSWQTEPRPPDHHECTEIRDIPVSDLQRPTREALASMSLHPTSELRVDLGQRWWQAGQKAGSFV